MRRILSLLPILALLAACGAEEAPPAPPPPEVGVITVQPSTVPLRKELVGRLAPVRSADVRARVPGVLQRRVYEEGSDVEEGDVLFLIDPAPLRATLASAEAALAQAQANAANAVAAANRARQLAPTEFISRSDLDNALAAERSTQAAAQAARASVESARINLGYATVRAPISGRAGKQQVTEGALVGEGSSTLLTTVDQIDTLYVNFSMGVSELAQVRSQQAGGAEERSVEVVLQDGSVYEHRGVLDFSGDVVDPATGAVSLRARVPNPDLRLLPGTYVTVNATLGELPGAFVVPQAAVLRDARGAYALVVGADGKVARKEVVTERAEDGKWIIGSGLAAGDRVIVSGLQKAPPGTQVNAVAWTPPARGGAPGATGATSPPLGAVEAQAGNAQPEPAAAEAAAAPAEAGDAQPATQD